MAYQAESLVNYDPVDKTVLANEQVFTSKHPKFLYADNGQVDANGVSWRSGAKVEKLNLRQWFLRITSFQEALLDDLGYLAQDNHWPDRVLTMQRHWLGRSRGANINFGVTNESDVEKSLLITVFTTRPDTLYGVQYLALSTDHPLVVSLSHTDLELKAFINHVHFLPADSKDGFLLSGFHAENPLSLLENSLESINSKIPIYVAPYVLGTYGEGAVMGVPGHDSRDYAFWKQNQGDACILHVIDSDTKRKNRAEPFEQPGKLNSHCGKLVGFSSAEASVWIIDELGKIGNLAEYVEMWKLRDWLISRQRYWGTPIPIIHCSECGAVPVPVDELPIELPKLSGDSFKSKHGNPLKAADDWVNTKCPNCGGNARRETDTMDTFIDSSWYFMRFADPHNAKYPFSSQAADRYLPVDIYIGGVEHAILHLLYARFISKFFASTSFWPSGGGQHNMGEPFRRLISQGMVHGKTLSDPETGRFLKPEEVDSRDLTNPKILKTGKTPHISWEKMSKSKYNGVDPTRCIKKYGADATRAHVLFQAPACDVLEWEEDRIVGIQRWFGRLWRLTLETKLEASRTVNLDSSSERTGPFEIATPNPSSFTEIENYKWSEVQRTILSVNTNLSETFTLNTIISDLMELTNMLLQSNETPNFVLQYHGTSALLRMLAPIAPAVAEECWEELHSIQLGHEQVHSPMTVPSIFEFPFPKIDMSLAAIESRLQTCVIQENGRRRSVIEIPRPSPEMMRSDKEEELREWVLRQIENTEKGRQWSKKVQEKGLTWKRIVVVRGARVVNFVH